MRTSSLDYQYSSNTIILCFAIQELEYCFSPELCSVWRSCVVASFLSVEVWTSNKESAVSKVWYWGTWLGAREMQAVCMKVVTSSSVDQPKKFWEGQILWLKASNGILFGHCLSKHKMGRSARNLGGMVPLHPWLRLWLQEKKRKIKNSSLLTWCSIFQTKSSQQCKTRRRSIDADYNLVFNKTLSQKNGSMGWGTGPAKGGQNFQNMLSLWRHPSEIPQPKTKNVCFSILTTRLAESVDGFDSSLAQSPGEL